MIKSKEGRTKGRVKVVEAINNEIPEVAVARDNDQLRRQDYLKLHYSITAAATTNCTGVEVPQYTYADIEVTCTDDFPLANNTHLEKPIEFFKQCNLIDVVGDTLLLQCPRSPTCFTGDGCAVNLKGCSVLDECFGVNVQFVRCQAHTADGSVKKVTKSKTMCVKTVVETTKEIKGLRTETFKNSTLHTGYLKEAMQIMEIWPLHIHICFIYNP